MASAAKKLDLKKELKQLYQAPSDAIADVAVPPLHYLMVDGAGDPNTTPAYREAVEALFAASYGLKFAVKKGEGTDYAVMPLEGLWWTADGAPFDPARRGGWLWTALIAQPSQVTAALLAAVLPEVQKKKRDNAALARLRLGTLTEGKSLQILHLGPYAAEGPTIARLESYARAHGYSSNGKHHEIYLNAPDRTPAAKLKTIIRHPVRGG